MLEVGSQCLYLGDVTSLRDADSHQGSHVRIKVAVATLGEEVVVLDVAGHDDEDVLALIRGLRAGAVIPQVIQVLTISVEVELVGQVVDIRHYAVQ